MMLTIIKNGLIVNADETKNANILIGDGKILAVGDFEKHIAEDTIAIDARGKYIFPGGIDPHVHFNLPTPAGFSADDFRSGSVAALYGGTTTVIDFITPVPGESLMNATRKRLNETSRSLINTKLHLSPIQWNASTEKEMHDCVSHFGITSFKCYMAYKDTIGLNDDALFRVMQVVGKLGGVLALHCEDGDRIDQLRDDLARSTIPPAKAHALSRPPETEAPAVAKAIEMAKKANCPIYIVHTSSALSLQHIKEAKARGQVVFGETCPQYLLLDKSAYDLPFEKAAAFVMSPPLRSRSDNHALWEAIVAGTISTAGTDHCPFSLAQKMRGSDDFRKIPNGAGGVEHRLQLLYTKGVLEKKITLNKFVEITSTNAARIFGLYPAKGLIAQGADADLVIWDPDFTSEISAGTHHSKCDLSIYEGMQVQGKAEYVFCNGKMMIKNGQLIADE
jgi:dihydropyrimidinase